MDIDALYEQLDNSRLLGGEQFVPHGGKIWQRLAHLGLGDAIGLQPPGHRTAAMDGKSGEVVELRAERPRR